MQLGIIGLSNYYQNQQHKVNGWQNPTFFIFTYPSFQFLVDMLSSLGKNLYPWKVLTSLE